MDWRHWGRATRALARNLPKKAFLKEVLDAALVADVVLPRATPVPFLVAYPEAQHVAVPMGEVTYRLFNMDPMEQFCLAALATLRQPKRIFEFGTYDGSTTLLLARAAPGAEIFTLDLPPEEFGAPESFLPAELRAHPDAGADDLAANVVGARFRGLPEADRITQLRGDSRRFDTVPFRGNVDMVVVDGGHDYETVLSDTANAFEMVSPAGVVAWDDYSRLWAHVVRAVDSTSARLGRPVIRVAPFELAIYDLALEELATDSYWSAATSR